MWQEDTMKWDKTALKQYVNSLIDEWFDDECTVCLRYDNNRLEIEWRLLLQIIMLHMYILNGNVSV